MSIILKLVAGVFALALLAGCEQMAKDTGQALENTGAAVDGVVNDVGDAMTKV